MAGNRSFSWEQIVNDDIKARGASISVWTRGSNARIGHIVFHVDFDDMVLEQQ